MDTKDQSPVLTAMGLSRTPSLPGETTVIELLGYKAELQHNRSLPTLLFQAIAMTALPFGFGTALISAVYGGGQLSIFAGFIGLSNQHS